MSRLNNSLKFILINANIIFALIGLFFFIVGIYLLAGNFGKLDPGFFLGTALVILFTGTSIMISACLGCQGANNQNEKFGSFWTGRKITAIYQLLLFGGLAVELFLLSTALRAAGEYEEVYPILESGESHDYVSLEKVMQIKFNSIYFSARTTCRVTVFNQFWDWIDNHCPENMGSANCQACDSYSVTLCAADETNCYSTSDGNGSNCPYTMCRAQVLEYMSNRIMPFSYGILAICAFQFIVALVNIMIMCYTPRDDLEKILIKSGTLATAKNSAD